MILLFDWAFCLSCDDRIGPPWLVGRDVPLHEQPKIEERD